MSQKVDLPKTDFGAALEDDGFSGSSGVSGDLHDFGLSDDGFQKSQEIVPTQRRHLHSLHITTKSLHYHPVRRQSVDCSLLQR